MPANKDARFIPALGYRWLTPAYDAIVATTTRESTFKAALIEQAMPRPGQHVLDLACGTGTLAIRMIKRHPDITLTGIDADEEILALASAKAAKAGVAIRFDQGFSYALPYPDAHFDQVVSSLFFHHLSWKDKQRTAAEIFRVLKPGGMLHLADWGRARGPLMRAAFVAIQILDGFENTHDNASGRLLELFSDAGFTGTTEQRTFATMFGTLALYRAQKHSSPSWLVGDQPAGADPVIKM